MSESTDALKKLGVRLDRLRQHNESGAPQTSINKEIELCIQAIFEILMTAKIK